MKRATRPIVLSVLVNAVISALTSVDMGLWFYLSHHESSPASEQSAEAEFSQLRSRFSTQQPLIDMSIKYWGNSD